MHPLAEKVASLQRRLVLRERVTAAMRIAAAVLAAALVLGLLDYTLRFADPGLRIMTTAMLFAVVVAAAYRWWYLPRRRPLTPLSVARGAEAHFPQLHDSLASAVEFLQQSEHDRTAGSAQLRRLVIAETETAVQDLPFDRVIDRRPLRRAAMWLAGVATAAAVWLAIDARALTTALTRLVAPLGTTDWPRQHYLAFRDIPERLAAGQAFEVELVNTAGELPDDARIEYRTTRNGRRQATSEPMTRSGEVMIARRENVHHPFAFRAVGGDDYSMRWHWVEVVEPPQVESLTVTVYPPAYTALPATPSNRHLHVLAGTGIELSGTTDKPLSAARILIDDDEPVSAQIRPDAEGRERRAFQIAPDQWTATKSASYRLELAAEAEPAAVVGQWNLRVEPDPPPNVAWLYPSDDLYVTRDAVIPIQVLVKDNLAVRDVRLVYERSDRSVAERERDPMESAIEVYRGPDEPPLRVHGALQQEEESQLLQYAWELSLLRLPMGAELTVHAEAADYRPGVGRTHSPRHIIIITAEELETRFADRQAQIARQLERALAIQQQARAGVRRLEIQQHEIGRLESGDRHALQAAELSQRRVAHMLADPIDGVPALVDSLLAELEMNRIASSEIVEPLERLRAELDRISNEALAAAERELTAARKALEIADAASDITQALAAGGVAQEDVLAILDRLVREFSGEADHRRFARRIAELRQDQIAHAQATRAEIGVETLPLRVNELSRLQRARLNQAAAGQTTLATRYHQIEQDMERHVRESSNQQSAEAVVAEAVQLARRLAIATTMHETARDFSDNRIGQALARESHIADDLQKLLDVLRGESGRRPEQLAANLRAAEQRLAELREQLATLREQIAQAEQLTSPDQRQLEQLAQEQQSLRSEIDELARQLERLQALDAGGSARSAADRLTKRGEEQPPKSDSRPTSSRYVQQAEQDLEDAARQLAARRRQAEDDLALQFVLRFQDELTKMVQRQEQVLKQTIELDRLRPTNGAAQAAANLAMEERELADMAREHSELLFGLGAVRVSLEEAERRLAGAAALLEQNDIGPTTQRIEQHALARLQAMMEAFEQTAAEAGQNQADQAADAGDATGDQPQRRPTFELLEVKMLRMLQADLHERTQYFQQRQADLSAPADASQQAEIDREARELAAEQARLAELVESMLIRDNESGQQ